MYEEAIPLLLSQGEGAVKRFVYLSSTCVSWPAALPDDEVPRGRAITQPFLLRVYKFKRRGEAALAAIPKQARCSPPPTSLDCFPRRCRSLSRGHFWCALPCRSVMQTSLVRSVNDIRADCPSATLVPH